jgi:hypothetical protein
LEAIDRARTTADFVAGVVVVDGETPLERVLAVTHYPSLDELDRPGPLVRLSHRLFGRRYDRDRVGGGYMAFSKRTWELVGGFPEGAYTGEDRGFTVAVAQRGLATVRCRQAAVRWSPPATWVGNARMFTTYARGDVRLGGRARHAARAAAWSTGIAALVRGGWRSRLALALGGLAYTGLPFARARRQKIPVRDWWRIPLVVAVKDLSQLAGAALGLADEARGVEQPDPRARV